MRANNAVVVLFLTCGVGFAQSRSSPSYTTPQLPATTRPAVTAPIIDLSTVSATPVGATNATAGLETGANNSTLDHVPASEGTTGTQAVVANPPSASLTAADAGQLSDFNAGVGVASGRPDGLSPLPAGRSLGEIAREYRARKQQAQNQRTLTNSDLAKLPGNDVSTVGGITGAATLSPTDQQQPATSQPSIAAPQRPAAPQPHEPTSVLPESLPKSHEIARTTTPPSSFTESPKTETPAPAVPLPGSASPLPLVALVGGALGVTGLLIRRRGK